MVDRLCDWTWEGHWDRYWDDWADSDDDSEAPAQVRKPSLVQERWISAFKQLSSCLVVLQVVVVHTDLQDGARTGLFGLLGDAPIQIVPMAEEARIDECFSLAAECESRGGSVVNPQDLERRSLQVAKQRLRDKIVWQYGTEELVEIMQPAIMFRLCTLMCNHAGLESSPPLPNGL